MMTGALTRHERYRLIRLGMVKQTSSEPDADDSITVDVDPRRPGRYHGCIRPRRPPRCEVARIGGVKFATAEGER